MHQQQGNTSTKNKSTKIHLWRWSPILPWFSYINRNKDQTSFFGLREICVLQLYISFHHPSDIAKVSCRSLCSPTKSWNSLTTFGDAIRNSSKPLKSLTADFSFFFFFFFFYIWCIFFGTMNRHSTPYFVDVQYWCFGDVLNEQFHFAGTTYVNSVLV